MGFDQYHEPAGELSAEARTFARMIASLTEEAEAIGWYEQRIALEPDEQARAIMANAQGEEFKHFGMDLEFLLRRTPKWRIALQRFSSRTVTSFRAARRPKKPRTAERRAVPYPRQEANAALVQPPPEPAGAGPSGRPP